MDRETDGWTYQRMEFLPILQDSGRCPATLYNFKTAKKQGKGTADLMMPFGDWFWFLCSGSRGDKVL